MPGAEEAEAMAVLGDLTDVTATPTPPARATFPRPASGRGGQNRGGSTEGPVGLMAA